MTGESQNPLNGCPSDEELELASYPTCPWNIREHLNTCALCQSRAEAIRADNDLIRELASAVHISDAPTRTSTDGFEGFENLEEIHRGGQGVVYRAVQTDTNRTVALKALRSGHFASDEERARFQREIELVARLRHPGIVTVFGSGATISGERFIAMEYVEGLRLDQWAQQRWGAPPSWTNASLKECATLFANLCEAAAHAQQRGVIHRDLKPSNVLVDESGAPRVLDFGIARESDDEQTVQLTQGHEFVGTYAYAAPEQFRGAGSAIGTWTDVYSIGVMAYEVLTGARPHPWNGSLPELTLAVCETEAEDPTRRNPTISKDLATIVLRALTIDPERRYQSAALLRDEFRRAAAGDPIEARRDNTLYVLRRMASKYRWRVAAGTLALFILLVAAPLTTFYAIKASQEANHAREVAVRLEAGLRAFVTPLETVDPETSNQEPVLDFEKYLANVAVVIEHELADYPDIRAKPESALALVYADRLKYNEAIAHMRIALKLRESFLDAPHRDLAVTHHNLGRIFWKAARYEESRDHYTIAMRMFTDLLGPDHPRTAETAQQLATTLTNLNAFGEAESLLRTSLATYTKAYGADDPRVALIWFSLGRCNQEQGKGPESVECFQRAYDMIVAEAGPEDFRVGRASHFLASALIDCGKVEDARPLVVKSMQNKERIFGRDNREFAVTELLLARIILREPDASINAYAHAETIARRDLDTLKEAYNSDQPETATALAILGEAVLRQDRPADAKSAIEHALAMRRELLPANTWPIGESLLHLAECEHQLGNTANAREHIDESLSILRATRREDDWLRRRAETIAGSFL